MSHEGRILVFRVCVGDKPSCFQCYNIKHFLILTLMYIYEGDSKSSRKSAAKFVIVMGNLRSLCML